MKPINKNKGQLEPEIDDWKAEEMENGEQCMQDFDDRIEFEENRFLNSWGNQE
jgi:hypothetical protein